MNRFPGTEDPLGLGRGYVLRSRTGQARPRYVGIGSRPAVVACPRALRSAHRPSTRARHYGSAFLVTAIGIPAGTIVALETGKDDPNTSSSTRSPGQWIALIACPVDWWHPLLALLLFRAFDIVKPWPARQLENLPGGWGIMLDDVAAGLYALLGMQIIRHWF